MEAPGQQGRWRESRATGKRKVANVVFSILFLGLAAGVTVAADRALLMSPVGFAVHATLIVVSVYYVLAVLVNKVQWNQTGIRQISVFGAGRLHRWEDLTETRTLTTKRATVLCFGLWRTVKIFWSFDAHGEIVDLAERKLNENAGTS